MSGIETFKGSDNIRVGFLVLWLVVFKYRHLYDLTKEHLSLVPLFSLAQDFGQLYHLARVLLLKQAIDHSFDVMLLEITRLYISMSQSYLLDVSLTLPLLDLFLKFLMGFLLSALGGFFPD